MKAMTKILAGTAGLAAAAAVATPAQAQYYPSPYGYGQNSGGVIGAILNSIINPYGRTGAYNYGGEQQQVEICVQAVNQRVSQLGYNNGGYSPYGGYNQPYGGYNQPYGYGQYGGGARVASVDRVERFSDGVKVRGTAYSNAGYAQPYGGYNQPYGGYNQPYGGYNAGANADVSYSCRVKSNMQIRDINLYDRRTGRQIG